MKNYPCILGFPFLTLAPFLLSVSLSLGLLDPQQDESSEEGLIMPLVAIVPANPMRVKSTGKMTGMEASAPRPGPSLAQL